MISSVLVLFLFGTAVMAGPLMPHGAEIIISENRLPTTIKELHTTGHKSPFIENFYQEGTNVFFKPQFMMAAEQLPPKVQELVSEIEEKCKVTFPMGPLPGVPITDEPLRIIEREFSSPDVKEMIEINPMAMAVPYTLPKTVMIEEPHKIEHFAVPELRLEPKTEVVLELEEPKMPAVIPPAPVLPPFEMPELPKIVEEVKTLPEVTLPEVRFSEAPVFIEIEKEKELVIPPAPVLPPMELPKMPVLIEEGEKTEEIHKVDLKFIPEAPVLPPYIAMPYINEVMIAEEPVIIPEAPELPIFTMPELPAEVKVEEKKEEMIEEHTLKVIPEAPVLPPLELPAPVMIEEPVKIEMKSGFETIPPAPMLPMDIPVPCDPSEKVEELKLVPEAPVLKAFAPMTFTDFIVRDPMNVEPLKEPLKIEPLKMDPIKIDGDHMRSEIIPLSPVFHSFDMPKSPIVLEKHAEVVAPCPPGGKDIFETNLFLRGLKTPTVMYPLAYALK